MAPAENSLVTIQTPLGEDALILTRFSGKEGISSLYEYSLDMVSNDNSIVFEDIIGQAVTVTLSLANSVERYFHGIISSFSQGEGIENPDGSLHLTTYSAKMVPWFWVMTKTVNSRIFQEKSVVDIVEMIFEEDGLVDYEIRLNKTYSPRTYCVQYQESDYCFISRLLEEEGIFYFFEHEQEKHTLVVSDNNGYPACPNQAIVRYDPDAGVGIDEDVVNKFHMSKEITFGKFTTRDFNFEIPNASLQSEAEGKNTLGPGERELYRYPGGYDSSERGDAVADLRMQVEEARVTRIEGKGNCRDFVSGHTFTLEEYYRSDMNQEYLLTTVEHRASEPHRFDAGSEGNNVASYINAFACLPKNVPYRPPLDTPKPVIYGSQTAIVVGPEGEEIYPDEYGRVKIKFHWDRDEKKDENSSCWVRVSQAWAGTGWGAMFIPRIGQEVIVQFINGDPDQPIITGRVYHGQNLPPYTLPDEKTKSTIKSDSTPGGGGSNEIRFEDSADEEEFFVHAQKDMNSVVENDKTLEVGGNRTTHITGNFDESIDGDETRSVGGAVDETITGSETRNIVGGVDETIAAGEKRTITGGLDETITGGETRTVNGNQTKTINGSKTETVAGGITVNTPAAYDVTAAAGITMTASAGVTVNAPGGYTLVAPGGNNTVDSWFQSIGGKNEDFFSIVNQATGIKNEMVGMANCFTNAKIDLAGFVLDRAAVKNDEGPVKIKQVATQMATGTASVLDYALTMIGL
jgi:type VI secretion system secreted protein VgrG